MTVVSADFLKGRKLYRQDVSSNTAPFKSFKMINNKRDYEGLNDSEFYLIAFIHSFKDYFGFEYISWVDTDGVDVNALCTYPERWVDFYIDHRLQDKDMIFINSAQGLSPFFWSCEFENASRSQEVNRLAHKYGITTRITIPMDFRPNGVTALSFSSARSFKDFVRPVLPKTRELLFLCYLFQMMMRACQQNVAMSQDSDYLMALYKEYLPQAGEIS